MAITDTPAMPGAAAPAAPIASVPPPPPAGPPPVRKQYQAAKDGRRDRIFEIDIDGHVFATRPGRVPGSVQFDFSGISVHHDPDSVWAYFRTAFDFGNGTEKNPDPEYTAFRAFCDDPPNGVDPAMLVGILEDMVEFSNGIPTGQPSS